MAYVVEQSRWYTVGENQSETTLEIDGEEVIAEVGDFILVNPLGQKRVLTPQEFYGLYTEVGATEFPVPVGE